MESFLVAKRQLSEGQSCIKSEKAVEWIFTFNTRVWLRTIRKWSRLVRSRVEKYQGRQLKLTASRDQSRQVSNIHNRSIPLPAKYTIFEG